MGLHGDNPIGRSTGLSRSRQAWFNREEHARAPFEGPMALWERSALVSAWLSGQEEPANR